MKSNLLFNSFFVLMLMAFSVNGQNMALQITDPTIRIVVPEIPESSTDWTFESWIYLDDMVGDYTGIIDARASDEPGASALVLRNVEERQFLGYEWGGSWDFSDGPDVPIGEWCHVAMVVSSATNTSTIYLNGFEEAVDDSYSNLGEDVVLGGDMRIGNSNGMDERALLGMMDEIRIWNIAKTSEEIEDDMYISVENDAPGLLIQYTCDDAFDGDEFLVDATGNYDATITGIVTYVEADILTSKEELKSNELNLFPTIASDMVTINGLELGTEVRIVNLSGQVIATYNATNKQLNIPVESYTQGMYLVAATKSNKVYNARFVKK